MDQDRTLRREVKTIKVKIKPGAESGDKLVVPRMGDKRPGIVPADIHFVIQDKHHDMFRRINTVDIKYVAQIR